MDEHIIVNILLDRYIDTMSCSGSTYVLTCQVMLTEQWFQITFVVILSDRYIIDDELSSLHLVFMSNLTHG